VAALTSAIELPTRTKHVILLGTMLGLMVAASNQTVLSTALPQIVTDLGGLELLSWVFTGYMLTSTIIVPIAGKLSDLYGRKPFFLTGVALFMLASAFGGAAQSMEQLIAVRAIQGLGGGMLISSSSAIIGDMFAPEERGRYQGYYISMFGVASILGPTMGGFITDYLSWRGIFYMNLPFGLAALFLVGTRFPRIVARDMRLPIDWTGVGLLAATLVCLLLALAWAGDVYAWESPEIAGLLGTAGVLLLLLLYVESKASDPVLPLHLFRNRVFAVCSALTFLSGVTLVGVLTFMPLFLQGVLGASATSSGLVISPMMIAVVVASNAGGRIVTGSQRLRWPIVIGSALIVAGMYVLSQFTATTTWPEAIVGMILVGIGIGLSVTIVTVAVQNSSPPRYLGVATSSTQFFRSIGSTLSVAVFGTLIVTGIQSNLDRNLPANISETAPAVLVTRLHDADVILSARGREEIEQDFLDLGPQGESLYDQARGAIEKSLADAVVQVFVAGFIVAAIALALSFLVPDRPKGDKARATGTEGQPAESQTAAS
jgi:EmrB/QacA subfamily drug resistance transporter